MSCCCCPISGPSGGQLLRGDFRSIYISYRITDPLEIRCVEKESEYIRRNGGTLRTRTSIVKVRVGSENFEVEFSSMARAQDEYKRFVTEYDLFMRFHHARPDIDKGKPDSESSGNEGV